MTVSLRLARHPLHPMLVHFPIALWTATVALDGAGWFLGQPALSTVAFGSLAAGLAVALLAMIAGALDYAAIPKQHAAQGTAVSHMLAMGSAWLLFMVSLALRGWPPREPAPVWAIAVALLGFTVMAVGGWLGGKLVYGFAIGVISRKG